MFAPEERRLIIGICMLLLLGAVVKSCRQKVIVEDIPAEQREKLERLPETSASETDERTN